ncbi:MAG: hypothetical protein PHR35_05050 [Kiritimatiellae bacterium]|nr:hypothetical protein [Kiritimatiellia bacterium]
MLDLAGNTYSGAVINASTQERTAIASRSLIFSNQIVNTIGTDVDTSVGNSGIQIDNMVLGVLPIPAPPSVYKGYITADGDFGIQSEGVTMRSPWNAPLGQTPCGSAGAQSPFENVFQNNGMGAYWTNTLSGPFFGQSVVPPLQSNDTRTVYVNFDVMKPTSSNGGYRVVLAEASYRAAVELFVNSAGLYARSAAGKGTSICAVEPGVWYNIQLELNRTNSTYSGVVTRDGTFKKYPIASRALMTNITIGIVFTDTGDATANGLPQANTGFAGDNWVIGNLPLAPAPFPPAGTLIMMR